MAKALKKAKSKIKTNNFYGFNIKLLSNDRRGEQAYTEILQDIYNKDIVKQVGSDKAATLRTQFLKEFLFDNKRFKVLFGKITRFTLLDGEQWYDQKNKTYVKQEIPKDIFPNGFEADYIFIPEAHRFYLQVQTKVSIIAVYTFLSKAIKDVIGLKEEYSVHLIQSHDVIDTIITSSGLSDLKISVSYTNDDIGDKAQQLIDKMLKDSHVGVMNSHFKPDQTGHLSTDSDMIRGFLEVAKENGTAEATILTDEGKKKKIYTQNYPEKVTVKTTETDDINYKLFSQIMMAYRNEQGTEEPD